MKNSKVFLLSAILVAAVSATASLASAASDRGVRILEEKILSEDGIMTVSSKVNALKQKSRKSSVIHSRNEFNSAPVSNELLSEVKGMFSPQQLGAAVFDAQATNNSASNTVTGYNSISNDALGNSKGVVSLIQNTGNNVIIQNATVVNLTMSN